jgi:hypothetical protein
LKVGFDIGGCIIGHGHGHPGKVHDMESPEDTDLFGADFTFLTVPPNEGAFQAIATIVDDVGFNNCYVISKCGTFMERKTRTWLEWSDFFSLTGFKRDHVIVCRERRQKAVLAYELGITDFVDDHPEVLSPMIGFIEHPIMYRPHDVPFFDVPDQVTVVHDWAEVRNEILKG